MEIILVTILIVAVMFVPAVQQYRLEAQAQPVFIRTDRDETVRRPS